jgi:predicted oxidoreductase
MKTYLLPHTDLHITRLAYGCMSLAGWDTNPPTHADRKRAAQMLETALELDINFFDTADIYGRGKCDIVLGEALKQLPGTRDSILIQTKCGIRFKGDPAGTPQRYDFSYENIVNSVEGSLRRLQTDHIDVLLLHRPDALVEPDEVARAFDAVQSSGKVRHFGVSNHSPLQIELLKKSVTQPLVTNQLEFNLLHANLADLGVFINQLAARFTAADGLLDYCRLNNILVQAWSPVAGGRLIDPPADATPQVRAAAAAVASLAAAKHTSREAIALGWILRHPAGIQPIVGTAKPERLRLSAEADQVELTREEWYTLLEAARGKPAA